jgi:hypothetical protein
MGVKRKSPPFVKGDFSFLAQLFVYKEDWVGLSVVLLDYCIIDVRQAAKHK